MSADELLLKNPKGYMEYLCSSGKAFQTSFFSKMEKVSEESDKRKLLREHITKKIASRLETSSDSAVVSPEGADFTHLLFKLLCFVQAWADFEETWINDSGLSELEKGKQRQVRQLMKFKKDIEKPTRRFIHIALFEQVYFLLSRWKLTEDQEEEKKFVDELLGKLVQSGTKASIIEAICDFLQRKKFDADSDIIEKSFQEAAAAILSFSPMTDKILYGLGVSIGVIAALSCGITTGAAIFVLLLSFSIPLGFAIPLSLLIFLAGTKANFQLFSQHVSKFLQTLAKAGGITEFIDQQGNRVQLSASKKVLLVPAALVSVSVGITTAAITILDGSKMIAVIFPTLATICPSLPVILLGILTAALLVGLSIVMFRTFIEILQPQFLWRAQFLNIIKKIRDLNWAKFLAYVLKAVFVSFALFGLFFLCVTGVPTLVASLGWSVAYVISLAAFIGDVPFTIVTAAALCTSLFTKTSQDMGDNSSTRKEHYLGQVVEFLALIINALGNAALVFADSLASRIASIACFINSYANNRIQEDDSNLIQARESATRQAVNSLIGFFTTTQQREEVSPLNYGLNLSSEGS